MKAKTQFLQAGLLMCCSLVFWGCGPAKPTETELQSRFTGNFCAEGYRLELRSDSSFFNMRVIPGALGSRPMVETCKGKYSFVFDDKAGEWNIDFRKDEGFSMAGCTGKIPVWNKKDGWVSKDSLPALNEWFDKKEVKKGSCEI